MFKSFLICAALAIPATCSVCAQEREVIFQKIEVPGADFHIVVATNKADSNIIDPHSRPGALIVYLMGSEFVHANNEELQRMFPGTNSIRSPSCAFNVQHEGEKQSKSTAVYVVPNSGTLLGPEK
ncbi:MAG: hypothetical protein WBX25_14150 [Rhodomicrobium sp.]